MRISTPSWTPHRGAAHEVALEVLINGPISRAQIARRLDLSAGSLTRLSQPLIEAGLIVEVGEHASGQAGRPSRLLDVIPESRHFIGLKLTGDEVLGAVIDLRANVIASGERSLQGRELPPESRQGFHLHQVGRVHHHVRGPSMYGGRLYVDLRGLR